MIQAAHDIINTSDSYVLIIYILTRDNTDQNSLFLHIISLANIGANTNESVGSIKGNLDPLLLDVPYY